MMEDDGNDQNTVNQFISNFQTQFITSPQKVSKLHQILSNDASPTHHYIQVLATQDQTHSPAQILQLSKSKVIKSKTLKSLSAINQPKYHPLKNSSLSVLKQKQKLVQKIHSTRYSEYKHRLSKSINKLQSLCEEHFGGIQNIAHQLTKQKLTQHELLQYYAQTLPKNTNLTKILKQSTIKQSQKQILPKLRSQSQKSISFLNKNLGKQKKKQLKLNKWYIDPQKRFSVCKEKTLYDWRTQEGLKNVIRTQQLKIKSKQINNLIKQVRQKFHREPLFCKYVKLS